MKKTPKYSPEVRERAVRMVQEHRGDYPSLWAAIESFAPKIGCAPQTLNDWIRKSEIDSGKRDGVTTEERERIGALEREVKELQFSFIDTVQMKSGLVWHVFVKSPYLWDGSQQ